MPWIQELARLIGRTPASVCMRMENFASLEKRVQGERGGLGNTGNACARFFFEWIEKKEELRAVAEFVRSEFKGSDTLQLDLFDSHRLELPRAFGRYELLDELGRGAFGVVFSCVDPNGDARALKILHSQHRSNREVIHRFVREIRAIKSVLHPHVIRVYEDNLDDESGFPAFAMELASASLKDYLSGVAATGKAFPLLDSKEAADILESVCLAVIALHSQVAPIIHRDINPNNILRLPDGRWVIADFSLAKFLPLDGWQTSFQTGSGTGGWGVVGWGAPEQFVDFKAATEFMDVFALGNLLGLLFTSTGFQLRRDELGLSEGLQRVFERATRLTPADRYSSVEDFLREFKSAVAGLLPLEG